MSPIKGLLVRFGCDGPRVGLMNWKAVYFIIWFRKMRFLWFEEFKIPSSIDIKIHLLYLFDKCLSNLLELISFN
jgi:hypothetical protein